MRKRWVVVKHTPLEQLDHMIKKEKNARVLSRLLFVRYLYNGDSVPVACGRVGVLKPVGYAWLERWNRWGYNGLLPNFGGGRPSKLGMHKKELADLLKMRDDWRLEEIRDVIEDEYGVLYSLNRLRAILKGLGMKHAKPLTRDYRRPDDAPQVLKKD